MTSWRPGRPSGENDVDFMGPRQVWLSVTAVHVDHLRGCVVINIAHESMEYIEHQASKMEKKEKKTKRRK